MNHEMTARYNELVLRLRNKEERLQREAVCKLPLYNREKSLCYRDTDRMVWFWKDVTCRQCLFLRGKAR